MNKVNNIARLFNVIDKSLFTVNGSLDYDRITDAFISLANRVHTFDGDTDDIWYIGEFGACCLTDLIVGAYWHYYECHGGQRSKSYAALSALGQVFDPSMADEPELDNEAYTSLNAMEK